MTKTLEFKEDAPKKYWKVFPKDFKKGDKIYKYNGPDYGLIGDDMRHGIKTAACTLKKGILPFFTVPVMFLKQ